MNSDQLRDGNKQEQESAKTVPDKVPSPSAPTPALPKLPPGYKYLKQISSGGQGVVWLVVNHNMDRHEAVKILHAMGKQEYERFCREIKTMASLGHPNI